MKLVTIGTSNTVIGRNGYLKALKLDHEVVDFSVGRVPFYMHISAILRNINEINESDFLIIDHLSNPGFISLPDYNRHLVDFYDILASINTNVVVLCFPHQSKEKSFIKHRELASCLAKERDISFIDFKSSYVNDYWFQDPQHIKLHPSYLFGEWLSQELINSTNEKPMGGRFSGYHFVSLKHNKNHFENSILSRNYTDIDHSFEIDASGVLLSLEYLTQGDSKHEFNINGIDLHISDMSKGVYHDGFMKKIDVKNKIKITNEIKNTTKPVQLTRKEHSEITPLSLIGFLLYDDFSFKYSTGRFLINFNVEKLKLKINNNFNYIDVDRISDEKINLLRDSAVALEKLDLNKAHALMREAYKARPTGPFIKKKLAEYEKLLADKE